MKISLLLAIEGAGNRARERWQELGGDARSVGIGASDEMPCRYLRRSMRRSRSAVVVAFVAMAACHRGKTNETIVSNTGAASHSAPAVGDVASMGPNAFLGQGSPTFILGTRGDALANRDVAVQAALLSSRIAGAKTMLDRDLGDSWPAHPVVYGDPRVNSALASIAGTLPFAISAGKLVIGGETFTGDDVHLTTVVPAAKNRPAMLVYAGTGTPGIAEINAVAVGTAPILVADVFGVLVTGTWRTNDDGTLGAVLSTRARRIDWRSVRRGHVDVRFPQMLPALVDEDAVVDACDRGLATAARALGLIEPEVISIYVYPDRRSKKELTGDEGDGMAMVEAHAVHVLKAPIDAMTHLLTHEGTHALAYRTWGPAGSPLFGEGLAVWAAGGYGGKTLQEWRVSFAKHPTVVELLEKGRALGEATLYPLAGLFVGRVITILGREKVRDHLLAATRATWSQACVDAGTTPDAMEKALEDAIATGP